MKKMWKYLLFLPLLAFMVACDDDDAPVTPEPEPPTLSEALDATAALSTLESAVGAVPGLVADLEGRDAITVFAPNNAAFTATLAAYGVSDLNGLVEEIGGPATLEVLLQYHVVNASVLSSELTDGQMITTLSGDMLEVSISGGTVSITDEADRTFNVVTADVEIANGVVHIIDGVLIPDPELLPSTAPTVVQALQNTPALSTLNTAVGEVDGLAADLLAAEEITVFAPNDDAFADALNAYGVDNLDDLVTELGGIENLELVLGFHVVPATAFSTDLDEGEQTFNTVAQQELTVTRTGDAVSVTDAAGNTFDVVTPNIEIANGVVHIIDGVLLPDLGLPTLVDAGTAAGLTTLLEAVTKANIGADLLAAEAITVFAPNNEAFGPLLERYNAEDLDDLIQIIGAPAVIEVLQFHVVPAVAFSHDLADGEQTFPTLQGQDITVTKNEEGVFVTDYLNFTYQVETADVAIANGVVHIIDGVVLPDLSDEPNVVEAATAAGLTTLIDAVVAAELTNPLLQATGITVFAPTNAAFANLLEDQEVADLPALIEKLGAPAVTTVLQFHVVPAVAFAADLDEGNNTFTTLAGQDLTVNKTGNVVTVTDAAGETFTVQTADVTIENGVVHVIDGVLLPSLE